MFLQSLTNANDVEGDLEMINLQGAFIVLIGGLFLSLFITAAEFANEVRNIVIREQVKTTKNHNPKRGLPSKVFSILFILLPEKGLVTNN